MPDELPARFREHLREARLLAPGSAVVVGVSGRSDSLALLHLLRDLAPARRLRLIVAHVQHGGGEAAAGDAAFVRTHAEALGLPSDLYLDDRPAGTEAGRAAERWRFFRHVATRTAAPAVATGETEDDLIEEFLERLLAGQAPPIAPPPPGVSWLRPLLPFTHEDCLAYLRARDLPVRPDPSALRLATTRQKLRLLVLPLLRRHFGEGGLTALATGAACAGDDAAFLADLAAAARSEVSWVSAAGRVSLDHRRWAALPSALRRRLLSEAVAAVTGVPLPVPELLALDRQLQTPREGSEAHGALKITADGGTLVFARS